MTRQTCFEPGLPLLTGNAQTACRACVILPARNEQATLARCLDALASQVDAQGRPLPRDGYEILLFLNNCNDRSAAIAGAWQTAHPETVLHIVERTLAGADAHVGTARRLLMDTAWVRLQPLGHQAAAILSTDADSTVAPDWIAQNLRALEEGADVVGGSICVLPDDLRTLPAFVQRCYWQDRTYASLVARLEDRLDPQPGDRCPRHLDHFGSSLACTPAAYAAAGGMPPVTPLEDEAFVNQARCANLQLRHDPLVRVYTSARLHGRAVMGLAGQLRIWDSLVDESAHQVPSAAFLEHCFRTLLRLREVFAAKDAEDLIPSTDWWRNTFKEAFEGQTTFPGFLAAVYGDVLIAEAFQGEVQEPIAAAIAGLSARLQPAVAGHRLLRYERTGSAARAGSPGSLQ